MIKKILYKIYVVVHEMSSYKRLYFIGLIVFAGRIVGRVFMNLWDMFE